MQITCEKCIGKGLIGGGPNPHLLEGRISTCPDCKGTGLVGEKEAVEEDRSAPVDNAPEQPRKGGILSRIFGSK